MAVVDAAPRLLTADDLLRLSSQGVRGELIRGVLSETMPTGMEHGEIVTRLVILLGNFIDSGKLGRLTASDSGVWLEREPDTVREPDIAYFSVARISLNQRVTGYAEIVPDLVVEVGSPGNSRRELNDKALMWLSFGVRLVWVVHPDTRTVDAHRPDRPVATLSGTQALEGLDVLPGFTCPVRDIFAP
ncbi:MAG: Uma2 family endonuclease [Chloroflexi bacterium]|nr:Uma2 family endonuclease [Chloroflexota bacterium]